MITRHFPVDLSLSYPFEYSLDKIVFFDIETTGFAAETTYLYLIGCIYYQNSSFHLIQWFSEDIREEKELLISFFEFLNDYEVLIHYNGSGFDIPYLTKKCSLHRLEYSLDKLVSIDLYKKIAPYKKVLKLTNYKQKSIEAFLQIDRKDTCDGGELIQIYQSYLGKKHYETLKMQRLGINPEQNALPAEVTNGADSNQTESEMLLGTLLLHNEDDIKGLLGICPILYYVAMFEEPIRIIQAGLDGNQLLIRFELSKPVPIRIRFGNDIAFVTAYDTSATLSIEVFEGELKHFYDNYKDYYYLPQEDTAVHKSIALYVDKEFREKAKPSNCYTRKTGIFAPQYEPMITPYFRHSYQDKVTFLELHTDFLLQEENLEQYVNHILHYLLQTK